MSRSRSRKRRNDRRSAEPATYENLFAGLLGGHERAPWPNKDVIVTKQRQAGKSEFRPAPFSYMGRGG